MTHGATRVERCESPSGAEPIINPTGMLPAFAHVVALATIAVTIIALGVVPLRAAGPVQGVAASLDASQSASDIAARRLMDESGLGQASARDSKLLRYNLGMGDAWDRNLNLETAARETSGLPANLLVGIRHDIVGAAEAGAEWLPRAANWSGDDATLLGARRMRSINVQSSVVRVLDRHLVRYRFTLTRHRVELKLTTAF